MGGGSECILGAKIVGVAIDIGSGDDLPILNDETGRGDGDLLACLEDFSRTKDLDFRNCQVVGSGQLHADIACRAIHLPPLGGGGSPVEGKVADTRLRYG